MICLYALLDTKSACIFTKTQLASGVHVVKLNNIGQKSDEHMINIS